MRRLSSVMIVLLSLMLCACAAPPAGTAPAPWPEAAAAPTPPATPAQAVPAQSVAAPAGIQINRSCRNDNDCAIKDVGNCCGAMPACVNINSPTDPKGVQDACAKSGRMSVCGFRVIESCQCVQGQCAERASTLDQGPVQVR